MRKYLSLAKIYSQELILITMLSLWSLVWDYQMMGQYQRVGRVKFFLLATAAIIAIRVGKAWHWTLGLFFLYVMGSNLHYGIPVYSSIDMMLFTATLLVIPEVWNRISRYVIEHTILAASVIHCVVGILNLFWIFPLHRPTEHFAKNDAIGLLGQPTVLGPFLCLAFAIALSRALRGGKGRAVYIGIAILNVALVIATGSAMSLASLAVVVLVFLLFYGGIRTLYALIVVVVALIALAYHSNDSLVGFSGRIAPWQFAIEKWQARPWFGYGLGSWSQLAMELMQIQRETRPWVQLHQEFLQGLIEFGIIGMSLIVGLMAALISRSIGIIRAQDKDTLPYLAGVALFAVNSLASFPVHLTPLGQLFALCVFGVLRNGGNGVSAVFPSMSHIFRRASDKHPLPLCGASKR